MDNNYFNNPYGLYTNPYTSPSQHASYQPPLTTNVIRVTSLEEAIMQTTRRPSDMVYFNQDKDEFYNVKIDLDGRKTWATFTYIIPNPEANTPASKADIAALVGRIEELERKVGGAEDAKLDG